jgi:putative ABC transport system permease protein
VASAAAGRLLSSMLFGVGPIDVVSLGAASLILGGVALVAIWLPARRATRVDPMIALRHE